MAKIKTQKELKAENEERRQRLQEGEDTLRAIREGDVDALVISRDDGDRVYTLKDAGRAYRVLVEEMAEGAVTLSLNGVVLYCNHRLTEILEAPKEKIIGAFLADFILPEHRARVEALLRPSTSGQVKEELTLCGAGGKLTRAVISFQLVSAEGARYLCAVIRERVTEDLAVPPPSEQVLRSQAATLREQGQLLDLAHDAIFVRDMRGMVTFWNRGAENMYGWSTLEAVGRVSQELMQTQFPLRLAEIEAEVIREGRWEGELRQTRRDGTQFFAASRWALQRDEQGLPIGILEINSDITKRKQAEDALRRLNLELEQRVQARTEEIEAANAELETELSERQQIEAELVGRNRELSVLYAISRATSESLNLDEGLRNAIKATLMTLGLDMGGVSLLEEDGETLRLRAHYGHSASFLQAVERTGLSEGASAVAADERRVVVLNLSQYPPGRLSPIVREEGLETIVALPVLAGDRLLGIMNLGSRFHRVFSPEEQKLLTAIGQHLGITVRNAQLYEAVQNELAGRRLLQAELDAGRARWETTVESMLDSVMLADGQGQVTYMNPALAQMLELPLKPELALDEHPGYYQLYHPDGTLFQAEALPLQRAALRGEEVRDVEVLHRTLDGREKIILWNASPLRSTSGDITGAVAVGRDITGQRKAEQDIRELNQALQSHSLELENANKELEAFSYSVSHDLRTPLYSISQFARLLLEEDAPRLSSSGQEYARLVLDNAQALIELVNALLDFSRVKRQPLRIQQVVPRELVHAALNELSALQQDRNIEMVVGEMPPCQADPVLLKQVYANLLSNALKFTRKRDPARIEIGYGPVGEGYAYYVRDNGVGFDATQAEKLFAVFQRFHPTDDYEGTGVGLAIAARIIRRHGGRIWAESQRGQGACFHFSL